jgi:hypothetical protein
MSHISLNQSHISRKQSQPCACSTVTAMPCIDSAVACGESDGEGGTQGAAKAGRPFLALLIGPTLDPQRLSAGITGLSECCYCLATAVWHRSGTVMALALGLNR